jgi:hypothetical protein
MGETPLRYSFAVQFVSAAPAYSYESVINRTTFGVLQRLPAHNYMQQPRKCLPLPLSGHRDRAELCPLSGVKRTYANVRECLLMPQSGHVR